MYMYTKVEAGGVCAHLPPVPPLPQLWQESNKPPSAKQPWRPRTHVLLPRPVLNNGRRWTTRRTRAGMPTLHSLPWLKVASMGVRLPSDHDEGDPIIFIRALESPYL